MQDYHIRPRDYARELLLSYIEEGGLKPGDKLPTERDLSEKWQLNRSTLRLAIEHLKREGVLVAKQGSGTYVAEGKFIRELHDLYSFSESARRQGRTVSSKLISIDTFECDKDFSIRFKLMLGDPIYRIRRLRLIDDIPVVIETANVPQKFFPGLENFDYEKNSLFEIFRNEYNVELFCGREKIGATRVTDGESAVLGLEPGSPAFWLVSETYDNNGQLIEYCRTIARPDRMQIKTVLEWSGSR